MSSSWTSWCSCVSQRWIFTILASIGICLASAYSGYLSITIIEIVVHTCRGKNNESCESYEEDSPIKRYPWNEYTQGIILSSFFWSSTATHFITGPLAERYGGKHLFGFGIFSQALLTFMTPFLIYYGGSTALIITRALTGLADGGLFPISSTMISQWTTPGERTKVGNAVFSGFLLGAFFGNILPGLIIKHSHIGWPAVFYFFGLVGILWFPFWLLLVYENPEVHPFISDRELNYLKSSLDEDKVKYKQPATPWKDIFLCKEFWAFTITYTGGNLPYYLMLSELPKYLANVVKFSLESNAYFSSLPYLFMWFTTMFSAWINDKILEKQWMSLTNVRKLLTTISTTGPVIFLLLASYAERDKTVVVIMFVIGIGLIGSAFPSLMLNALDLSPNYAGSIMSAGSGIASIVGIVTPYFIGIFVPNSTLAEWRLAFWIVFLLAVASNAVYLVWFKAEVKPWNDPTFVKTRNVKDDVLLKMES